MPPAVASHLPFATPNPGSDFGGGRAVFPSHLPPTTAMMKPYYLPVMLNESIQMNPKSIQPMFLYKTAQTHSPHTTLIQEASEYSGDSDSQSLAKRRGHQEADPLTP